MINVFYVLCSEKDLKINEECYTVHNQIYNFDL